MQLIHSTISRCFLLLCLAVFAASAHGQSPSVKLRFVSFPKPVDYEPIELRIGDNKTMVVEMPSNSMSKIYTVPARTNWALGKTTTDQEGRSIFQTYGQAASAGPGDQLILVLRQGANDADGLKLIPLKYDDQGFGGGTYLLMNSTRVEIAGMIGTGKFMLKPGQHKLLAPEPTKTSQDRKYCYAKIFFRHKQEVQPFFSATWRFNKSARSIVFFYHDPKTKQLRLHTIRSFLE